ncbi:MAG TPA: hypothetical protein VG324_10875 [Blastocatellia bacterium]|nr:hypothetical protein [Blastocatellia bacterium]
MQTQVKDPKESTVSVVIDLNVEEMEEVIAPQGIVTPRSTLRNHNETLIGDEVELSVEDMEEVIVPQGLVIPRSTLRNHNETLVGEIELNVEELEEVIAPAFTSFLSFGDVKGESIDKEHREYN